METTERKGKMNFDWLTSTRDLLATEASMCLALFGWSSFDGPLQFISLSAGTVGAVFFCFKLYYDMRQAQDTYRKGKTQDDE